MKLSIGKAWEEASAFLGKEARLVAPVALATFALPSVLASWAYPGGSTGGGAGLLMLLVLLAAIVGQMTIVLLVNGWRGSVGEALTKAARRSPIPIAALVIIILPLMLIAIVGFGTSMASAGITDPAALTPEAIAKLPKVGWLLLFFIVALIVILVRFFPISAIAASEPIGVIKLIKRSWNLTKGSFWRLLALVLLLGIIALVLGWAVTGVVGSIAALAAGEPRAFNLSALIVALASGLVGAVVSTVSAAMVGRVYAQLAAPDASVPKA